MSTGPTGSATTYGKSGQCSSHAIKEDIIHKGSWKVGTGTMYPNKNHQRMNGRGIIVKGMDHGKSADSPDSYPMKQWQKKFGTVRKQV